MLADEQAAVLLEAGRLFTDEIVLFFLKNEYSKVVQLLQRHFTLFKLHPSQRALLGFCLVADGYTPEGLRELSLAVEYAPVDSKGFSLLLLFKAFQLLGKNHYATLVLKQLKCDQEFLKRLRKIQTENTVAIDSSCVPVLPHSKREFRSRYISSHRTITQSILDVDAFPGADEPLNKIFDLIMKLIPTRSFEAFLKVKPTISSLEVKWVKEFLRHNYGNVQTFIIETVQSSDIKRYIVLKTILSFSNFCEGYYSEACSGFMWIINLLLNMEVNDFHSFKGIGISSLELRSLAILFSSSFIHQRKEPKQLKDLDLCLSSVVSVSDNLNSSWEISQGRLSTYFGVVGLLYLERSFSELEITGVLGFDSLEEMIRKFILVSVIKSEDDPNVSSSYEMIITGLLLYGGVHVRTIWFFNFLKEIFRIQQCLLECLQCDDYSVSSPLFRDVTERLPTLLSKIVKCESKLTPDIREIMLFDSQQGSFQLPYVHLTRELKFRLSSRPSNPNLSYERMVKSNEFVMFWITCFKEYRSVEIPSEILDYIYWLDIQLL